MSMCLHVFFCGMVHMVIIPAQHSAFLFPNIGADQQMTGGLCGSFKHENIHRPNRQTGDWLACFHAWIHTVGGGARKRSAAHFLEAAAGLPKWKFGDTLLLSVLLDVCVWAVGTHYGTIIWSKTSN